MAHRDLADLQRLVTDVVRLGTPVTEHADLAAEVDGLALPRPGVSRGERLEIYREMYWARHLDEHRGGLPDAHAHRRRQGRLPRAGDRVPRGLPRTWDLQPRRGRARVRAGARPLEGRSARARRRAPRLGLHGGVRRARRAALRSERDRVGAGGRMAGRARIAFHLPLRLLALGHPLHDLAWSRPRPAELQASTPPPGAFAHACRRLPRRAVAPPPRHGRRASRVRPARGPALRGAARGSLRDLRARRGDGRAGPARRGGPAGRVVSGLDGARVGQRGAVRALTRRASAPGRQSRGPRDRLARLEVGRGRPPSPCTSPAARGEPDPLRRRSPTTFTPTIAGSVDLAALAVLRDLGDGALGIDGELDDEVPLNARVVRQGRVVAGARAVAGAAPP